MLSCFSKNFFYRFPLTRSTFFDQNHPKMMIRMALSLVFSRNYFFIKNVQKFVDLGKTIIFSPKNTKKSCFFIKFVNYRLIVATKNMQFPHFESFSTDNQRLGQVKHGMEEVSNQLLVTFRNIFLRVSARITRF